MHSTPNKRRSLGNIFAIFSPGCKKQPNEMGEDFQMMAAIKKEKSAKDLLHLTDIENLVPKQDSKSEWMKPDLILQKDPRVFRTSTLGHGNEHKDEDFKELSQQFTSAYNDKTFADIIFKVGPQNKVIYAHKVIVGNRSLFFRGHFSKSTQNVAELSFPEYSYSIFDLVIKYMYSGTIILKLDNVLDVLNLSEKFNIRSLSVLCCDFIQTNLDYNNVCMVLQAISKYNCPRLYQYCLTHIDKTILNVLRSESFLDLSEELLILIISRDELQLKPVEEINVFHAVFQWAKHNGQSNDTQYLSKLAERVLKHIRFPLMPKDDLTNVIEPSCFVPQDLLMEAFKNHLVPQQSNHERFSPRLMNARKK